MSEPVPICEAHDGGFSQRDIMTAIVWGFDRAIASYTPGLSEVRPHTPCLEIAWLAGCRLALCYMPTRRLDRNDLHSRFATPLRVVLHMQLQ